MNGIESLFERISNASDIEEDRSDPRFYQIQSDMEKGNFSEATQLLRDLFNEGYFDIRLINYYLYNHILEAGGQGIVDSLKTLHLLLENHSAKILPLSARRKQSASAVKWLLTTLVRSLKRAATKVQTGQSSPLWNLLIDGLTQDSLNELSETLQASGAFFQEYFKDIEDFGELFGFLYNWARELEGFLPQESLQKSSQDVAQETVKDAPQETQQEPDPAQVSDIKESELPEQSSTKKDREVFDQPSRESYPWTQLKKKLQLFERLVTEESPDADIKRAIAIHDICSLIENFNPAEYFPEEFTNFYARLAQLAEPPKFDPDSPDAFGWNTLASLYRIDLKAFERWRRH